MAEEAPQYPGHGKPCNGCGRCCQKKLCDISAWVFYGVEPQPEDDQLDGPCRALERDGGRFVCGLMVHPEKYVPAMAALHGSPALVASMRFLMGVDLGCDLFDRSNGSFDAEFYRKRQWQDRVTLNNAMGIWGLSLL